MKISFLLARGTTVFTFVTLKLSVRVSLGISPLGTPKLDAGHVALKSDKISFPTIDGAVVTLRLGFADFLLLVLVRFLPVVAFFDTGRALARPRKAATSGLLLDRSISLRVEGSGSAVD